ncbi:uncharacterized protein BDCG_08913 [Blastomyces dermatitidis ER-3]|uniref:Uncharacterized protein n=1 Tax=Ajellomyces dermatitidis (strain ER-3 / ATCC MYA-2586) TaxID=559297 RepID=A0ABP2EQ05_AJEDR|nr:uncharacterized protein BDCG_08913 [Blastomyces dermatitidis ER-3]EEQ85644.2 hypothetical protein BDCG_08913 [Blastomyces dermatitidis ER-3]
MGMGLRVSVSTSVRLDWTWAIILDGSQASQLEGFDPRSPAVVTELRKGKASHFLPQSQGLSGEKRDAKRCVLLHPPKSTCITPSFGLFIDKTPGLVRQVYGVLSAL